jgi:acyl-coenzyme A synthetase/AMP-(fatty) acid ligase
MISGAQRTALATDVSLGAGNFVHRMPPSDRSKDTPLVWFDPPWITPEGVVCSSLTRDELHQVVDTYAGWYHAHQVSPRDPVAIHTGSAIEFFIHYLALTGLGAIPVLVNGELPASVVQQYLSGIGVVGSFADAAHREAVMVISTKLPKRRFCGIATDVTPGNYAHLPMKYPYQHDDTDPVIITHSSGTTGLPKAVMHSHQSLFYATRYRLTLPIPGSADRLLSALPGAHNSAISLIMFCLLNDIPVKLVSSQRADVVLRAIEEFRPHAVAAFSTTYAELAGQDLERHDLSSVGMWYNSGDAAHEPHIRRMTSVGRRVDVASDGDRNSTPGSLFLDGLGSSEMGHSLFYNLHGLRSSQFSRCIGRPYEFVIAAALDPVGTELPPGEVGLLGVKSPTITPGYWNDSLTTYRSRLAGYWLTGDLVYRDELGLFYHVDRATDTIRTATGTLYSVQAEELILRTHEGIADCTLVGIQAVGEPAGTETAHALLRLTAHARPGNTNWTEVINDILADQGMPAVASAVEISSEDLPVGPTGKVKKRELRERFRASLARTLG